MRKNGYSNALRDFQAGLARAAVLQRIERQLYRDPPSSAEVSAVEALRGSATVLLVANLEKYLKDALEEYVERLAIRAHLSTNVGLPQNFKITNDTSYPEWIIRDSRWKRERKHSELERIASIIHRKGFIPESFSRTKSNPGVETVSALLKDFGLIDPFRIVELALPRHYAKAFAAGFAKTQLTTIVTHRNQVAHGASSLGISRQDLKDWTRFIHGLAKSIDNALRDHTRALIVATG